MEGGQRVEAVEKKRHLSWAEVAQAIDTLAVCLPTQSFLPIGRIIAVARGGLVPAAMLAHRLRIQRVESIQVVGYAPTGTERNPLLEVVGQIPAPTIPFFSTVVVDDIVDTGRTQEAVVKLFPESRYVSIVARDPNTHPARAPIIESAWVVFPWEVE